MGDTYSQIIIQLVFAVQGRQSLIAAERQEEVNKYVTGIVRNKGSKMIAVNGMPDHLHALIGLHPAQAVSDLVRDIKADSNEWINKKRWVRGKFSWQEGYGAFSYSRSQLDRVAKYVINQREHHAKGVPLLPGGLSSHFCGRAKWEPFALRGAHGLDATCLWTSEPLSAWCAA